MKTILVAALFVSLAALAFGASRPVSAPLAPPSVTVAPDAPPAVVDLPTVVRVADVRIVGQAPRRTVARAAKVWACGAMYDNKVGGRNADCEWR